MSDEHLAFVTPQLVTWMIQQGDLDRAEIARSLGVCVADINAWESGAGHPEFDAAIAFAELLNLPFGYLFLSKEPPKEVWAGVELCR